MAISEVVISALSGGVFIKALEFYFGKKKSKAEIHKLEAEADHMASDSWEKLFKQVNEEWQEAKKTIAQSAKDIISLRKDLYLEREECNVKMEVLRDRILEQEKQLIILKNKN